jgi:adhesin transport system outer membrane protein
MMRITLVSAALVAALAVQGAQAITLKEAAQEAVLRNPEILANWHTYKSATEEIGTATGARLPKVDAVLGVARETKDTPIVDYGTYTRRGASLYLSQMLFDGFMTRSEIKRLSHAQRVRYFEMLDTSENTALEAARAYIDVQRYRALHKLAQDNYVKHRQVYDQIQDRVKSGVGRKVDLETANGRLALAESNLLTEASNLHDVSARYQRIVGTLPPADMKPTDLTKLKVPTASKDVLLGAYQQHPALNAAQENIIATTAEAEARKSKFWPRVDLRARKDMGWDLDGIKGDHDTANIELLMNYNLYNGGIDKAAERQYWERVNVAKDLRDKTCRDVRQTLSIAHNDVSRLAEQLTYLDQHRLSVEKAREAYQKQFEIGQRTLLDLLDTENEYFQAERAYVIAQYDRELAFARTEAGMGNLLTSIGLQRLETPELKDTKETAEFDPYSVCPPDKATQVAVDKDKIFAEAMANAPKPAPAAPVAAVGAAVVAAGDAGALGAGAGSAAAQGLRGVNFDFDSSKLRADALTILDADARNLKINAKSMVEVAGHTDNVGPDAYNQRLSERRAWTVANFLMEKGVDKTRLQPKGYGEKQPAASNATEDGRAKNRRVDLKVSGK